MHRRSLRVLTAAWFAILATAVVGLPAATSGHAAEIKVEFDDNAGGKNDGARGRGSIGNANFGEYAPFSSRGFDPDPNKPGSKKGSLIRNASDHVLEDLHLKLTSGDTFDPASTGGGAFSKVTLSADKKEIWFSGGNIKPGDDFYSFIPKSADFAGGVGRYQGRATPKQAEKKDEKKTSVAPETGEKSSAQITYDGAGGFTTSLGNLNFVTYRNGTTVTANSATESIIGSPLTLSPLTLIGPSPDLPGAYRLSDALLFIENGSDVFLSATLQHVLLIPDGSVPGFDTLLQGTLSWTESMTGLNSRFLDEFYAGMVGGHDTLFDFYTNLLGVTGNLATAGTSFGILTVNSTIPEPSTLLLLGGSMFSLLLGRRRRQRNGIAAIPR
jgi:hypothetical protein